MKDEWFKISCKLRPLPMRKYEILAAIVEMRFVNCKLCDKAVYSKMNDMDSLACAWKTKARWWMRFKIFCCRCENANSASLSQWRKHFFLQIQMLIFRPERPDRSAEKVSDIAERLFLIVCLKMHKVLCCQQWQRGLKACAVDSEVIACCDIPTNYPTMLICGLLEISMPALASAL